MKRSHLLSGLPLLLLAALPAQAQRYRSEPLKNSLPFDAQEAADLMAIGPVTVRGQASATFKKGLLSPSVTLQARNQVAFLLPMTRFLKAWVAQYAEQEGGLRFAQYFLQPELDDVAARTLTDAEGRFAFRGLRPGQYLLWVAIPYEVDTERQVPTGESLTRTWSSFGIVTAAVREPVTRTERSVTKLENHVIHVITVPEGQTELDLGVVQGEKAGR